MNRSEILDELDPDWRGRYRGDVERAWDFYYQFARADVERITRDRRGQLSLTAIPARRVDGTVDEYLK